jgi:hypothetical protein
MLLKGIIIGEIVRSGQNEKRKVAGYSFRVPGLRAGITQRRRELKARTGSLEEQMAPSIQ